MPKLLVVNADDFGLTRGVNAGVVECHLRGIVTSASLMANGEAFEDAVALARRYPTLDLGAHIALVGGPSVAKKGQQLPGSLLALLTAMATRRVRPLEEARAQLDRILSTGLKVSHLDTHKHTHLFPKVAEALATVAKEYGIFWVRRPPEVPWLGWRARRRFSRIGCRMSDRLLGVRETGRLDESTLLKVVSSVGPGLNELMCHPGYYSKELERLDRRLRARREAEIKSLASPRVREQIRSREIRLLTYGELR